MPRTRIPIHIKQKRVKVTKVKTKEERAKFMNSIKMKFAFELGLSESLPAVAQLYSIMAEWVDTGQSVSGRISFPEAPLGGRIIEYILSNRHQVQCKVNLLMSNPVIARRLDQKGN